MDGMHPGSPEPEAEPAIRKAWWRLEPGIRRALLRRGIFLLLSLAVLYILWPSLASFWSEAPELLHIAPGWFVVMFACEAASIVCIWSLQRLVLRTTKWFAIGTAQLAGNGFSRVVPGGAAAGSALSFRMLVVAGVDGTNAGASLTAAGLISTGTVLALPIVCVPLILLGEISTGNGLVQAGILGLIVLAVGFVAGYVLFTHDRVLGAAVRSVQRVMNRVRRGKPPITDLEDRVRRQRDSILEILRERWSLALLFALGNWVFDYLALVTALVATTPKEPDPTLVLLAYVGAQVLTMIPLTPGGLGFVEAGLTGMLVLAGFSSGEAAIAALAYRLASYWLPIPLGGVAYLLHRHRYITGRRAAHAAV